MLEKAKETTVKNGYKQLEYARFADDLVVLVSGYSKSDWTSAGSKQTASGRTDQTTDTG